ncbi:hypothetical protein [Nocardioides massiliensis]|uniref:GNAT family N-acetyltransferase n=1 Tax=Nocardioides massiliensis TaxID=1325935 RepID=A0ABT9NJV7_9ACTN|nr:hypothetical protein [Nocardioides massiliensis]MDP9820517.1 hypothetical protein [Nocardioides massiliensis]
MSTPTTVDHGTLRDDDGEPLEYRVLHPSLPNIPLAWSQVWPGRFTDWQAGRYAAYVESLANKRLGLVACDTRVPHMDWVVFGRPCPSCGAAL